ncbi:MAG: ParB N-terminal domain-containing protein [Candidatus Bathyarchaeia archaeon]|jgi:hypothetical protein
MPITNDSDETEVVKYFLQCEIGKIAEVWKQQEDFVNTLNQTINNMIASEAVSLAVALSGCYRNNPLCQKLRKGLDWSQQNVSCEQLFISQIKPEIDVFLRKYDFNLAKFAQYMKSDGINEERLSEFRDDQRRIWHPTIITEDTGFRIQILDGSHRAVILALRGASEIPCYVGYKGSQNASQKQK